MKIEFITIEYVHNTADGPANETTLSNPERPIQINPHAISSITSAYRYSCHGDKGWRVLHILKLNNGDSLYITMKAYVEMIHNIENLNKLCNTVQN